MSHQPLSAPSAWQEDASGDERRLFVVRESNQSDRLLFDAMREQTYQGYRGEPQVEAVRQLGSAPLTTEQPLWIKVDGTTHEVVVQEIIRAGTRAVLFRVRNDWHLWSMTSAARMDSEGVNQFTEILAELVDRIRPDVVIAANFSRLIRSQDQGNRLQYAFANRVRKVVAGNVEFPFEGPQADVGKMMFGMFATIASMERNWIVARLLTGKIAKWRRGEWAHGRGIVPFGYRYDKSTKRLVPVPELQGQVRSMLVILGSDRSPRATARALIKIGVTSMGTSHSGKQAPLAAIVNAHSLLDSLYAWAPLWLTGEHLLRITCPLQGFKELAGVPVTRGEGDLQGELQLLHHVDLPDGGWAEREVLERVRRRAIEHNSARRKKGRGGDVSLSPAVVAASKDWTLQAELLSPSEMRGVGRASKKNKARGRGAASISLLSGMSWVEGTWRYELQVAKRGQYRVVRRPAWSAAEDREGIL
ncbi:recombinase family protein [Puerhibacterium sp. TATVAM-FAB25]|uniref:recombinase family protein n=1 Tax=Puerhibacterium sp. TATVAM-FAB25 TaxID=3093699 RepID=UPI00397A1108